MTTIAVVDYGMGNRRSVEKALEHVGARALVTRDPAALESADALVVPGVGAFPQGMRNLIALGLDEHIRAAADAGKPVLGICLGMQLLFERSQEHELTEEFFRALAANAKLTLHLTVEAGTNAHHVIEAAFKACARALRAAMALDPTENGVPSTKGTLT